MTPGRREARAAGVGARKGVQPWIIADAYHARTAEDLDQSRFGLAAIQKWNWNPAQTAADMAFPKSALLALRGNSTRIKQSTDLSVQ